jgi:hypothetical protein
MRITTMITMTALMGLGAQAAEPVGYRPVTVCMDSIGESVEYTARTLATKMFANIGVTVDWRNRRACPAEAILISLADHTPENRLRGALAYALPYEGVHIRVFYDRIRRFPRELVPRLLAHVLVHEISHILQGIDRHSKSGVMKAYWTFDDYHTMLVKPLRFEDQDIDLIRGGLAAPLRLRSRRNNAVVLVETSRGEQP